MERRLEPSGSFPCDKSGEDDTHGRRGAELSLPHTPVSCGRYVASVALEQIRSPDTPHRPSDLPPHFCTTRLQVAPHPGLAHLSPPSRLITYFGAASQYLCLLSPTFTRSRRRVTRPGVAPHERRQGYKTRENWQHCRIPTLPISHKTWGHEKGGR